MGRARWKGPYVNSKHLELISTSKKQHAYIISRNSEIIPKFLGLTFNISNGKSFTEITITDPMIGHKFGEFAATRANFSYKKKKSKK